MSIDTVEPTFTSFPGDITKYIASAANAPVEVTWTEPVATDNSGVTPSIQSDHNSGQTFGVGDPIATVIYTITDEAGNTAMDSFTISVIVGELFISYKILIFLHVLFRITTVCFIIKPPGKHKPLSLPPSVETKVYVIIIFYFSQS